MVRRLIAKKVRIADIRNGKYSPGSRRDVDGTAVFKASYIITPFGERVSRTNVVATVTDKFASPEGNYATLTLDDGTDSIQAKVFGEDVGIFADIKKGSLVCVIGKVKEYQGEVYIGAEVVRSVEADHENLRRLELLENLEQRKRMADNLRKMQKHMSEEDLKAYAKQLDIDGEALSVMLVKREVDYKPKLLDIIATLDEGDGAEITKIFDIVKLPDSVIERTIDELLADGSIYEPMPGKFKQI
jgi:RPA family protein